MKVLTIDKNAFMPADLAHIAGADAPLNPLVTEGYGVCVDPTHDLATGAPGLSSSG